jgi:serine/threonine protein kinase
MNLFHLNIYLLSLLAPAPETLTQEEIKEFSNTFFSKNEEELTLKEHSAPKDLAEAGLGDPIFMVLDKNKQAIGVIKTISIEDPDGRASFRAEYEALDQINHLPLKHFHAIHLRGTSETISQGIIAQDFAKGSSLNSYLKKISKTSNSKERTLLLNQLKRAVSLTATSLAELHNYQSFPYPEQKYLMKYDTDHPPGPFGMIHGDTHPGNIFYDEKTDSLTFIDFGSANLSEYGAPVLQDAANFLLTLEIFASYYKLNQAEITLLTETFTTNYQAQIPSATPEALTFYKNYFLKTFADPDNWDPKFSDQSQFIQTYCHNSL